MPLTVHANTERPVCFSAVQLVEASRGKAQRVTSLLLQQTDMSAASLFVCFPELILKFLQVSFLSLFSHVYSHCCTLSQQTGTVIIIPITCCLLSDFSPACWRTACTEKSGEKAAKGTKCVSTIVDESFCRITAALHRVPDGIRTSCSRLSLYEKLNILLWPAFVALKEKRNCKWRILQSCDVPNVMTFETVSSVNLYEDPAVKAVNGE